MKLVLVVTLAKMKFVLAVTLAVLAAQGWLIGTAAPAAVDSKSALEPALRPLYNQLDTMRYQLDAIKALVRVPFHKDSEWQMVYRGLAGHGVGLFDMWIAPSWDAKTMSATGSWRDESLRDEWINGQINVKRVKLSVLDREGRRIDLTFNGTGTDIYNWFSLNRLISSPWDDLQSAPVLFFSIDGHKEGDRRFFISSIYDGCPNDKGWLVVTQSDGFTCEFEQSSEEYPYPIILFSRLPTRVKFDNVRNAGDTTVGRGDILTIHVDAE